MRQTQKQNNVDPSSKSRTNQNALLQKFMHSIETAVVITDNRLNIILAPPLFCHLLGKEAVELIHLPLYNFVQISGDVLHKRSTDAIIYPDNPKLRRDAVVSAQKIRIAGDLSYLITVQTPETETDFTNLFVQQERMATIGSMTADIVHEIVNPLSVVGSASEALSEFVSTDQFTVGTLRQYTRMIAKNSQKTVQLVDTLRAYMAQDSVWEPTQINHLIENAASLMSNQIEKAHRLTLNLDLTPDLPKVECNPSEIMQVILSLMTNAKEAVLPNKGQIALKSWTVPEIGSVAISVRDTGKGLPSDGIQKLFDPTYSKKAEPPSNERSNLGLFIASEIIKRHNGLIRAQNWRDERSALSGAQFTVLLPTN